MAQVDGLVTDNCDSEMPYTDDPSVGAYVARPQTESEVSWSDEATVAMIADEPW